MDEAGFELTGGVHEVGLEGRRVEGLAGVQVRADLARALTSTHRHRLTITRYEGDRRELTRDLPNVAGATLVHLQDDGLVRVGAEVAPGDVLIGVVEPKTGLTPLTQEEKLLRAMFGEAAGDVRDVSLRCPPGTRGRVSRVWKEPTPDGEKRKGEVHCVEVEEIRPLRVGDTLRVSGAEVTVEALVDGQAIALEGAIDTGRHVVAKVRCAEDALEARSIGPYSIISQQPLGGKANYGGQRVPTAALAHLEEHAPVLARELMTVKSDCVMGRTRLYESLIKGEDPGLDTLPESALVTLRVLRAAAIDVQVMDDAPPPKPTDGLFSLFTPVREIQPTGLALRLLDAEALLDASHGEVKKPETLNYRTFRPEAQGLFCSRIFGPVRDYECLCGKYTRMKHRGVVCEKCGVEVIQSRVRRERFGHVDLAVPLMHPWAAAFVAETLGLSVKDVHRIVDQALTIDLQEREPLPPGGASILGGSEPIAKVGVEALAMAAQDTPAAAAFFDRWPVLPPDLRPLVPLSGGRWATSDLNDLYRRLINRNNRTLRLIELNAPEIIIRNEIKMLQDSLDALVENGARGKTITGPDRRPLRSLAQMLMEPGWGLLRMARHGKRVDYSGAAVAVPCGVAEGTVRVPRAMALEIFKPWLYGRLEALGYVTTIKSAKRMVQKAGPEVQAALTEGCAHHPVLLASERFVAGMRVELWDELALGLSAGDLARAGVAPGEVVQVHVPASEHAIAETTALGVMRTTAGDTTPTSPFARAVAEPDPGPTLFELARQRLEDPLEDTFTRRLLGVQVRPSPVEKPAARDSAWIGPSAYVPPEPEEPATPAHWDRLVEELEFSIRTANCLQNAGIRTVGQLAQRTHAELLKTKNFGRKSLKEVIEMLASMGLTLGMRPGGPVKPVAPVAAPVIAPVAAPEVPEAPNAPPPAPADAPYDDLDDLD